MHWRRRWRRGYNHSDLLAQSLSKQLVIPYMPKALVKNRMTPTQQGQNRLQRQSNLRGTFTFGTLPSNIRHVAIVDDVVTTGSTILEITHLLHEHGVKLVDVYCLCRTSAGQM
nr:phosphoribosyltransferase family protein [Vibrio agarilyticus]